MACVGDKLAERRQKLKELKEKRNKKKDKDAKKTDDNGPPTTINVGYMPNFKKDKNQDEAKDVVDEKTRTMVQILHQLIRRHCLLPTTKKVLTNQHRC